MLAGVGMGITAAVPERVSGQQVLQGLLSRGRR